MKETWDDIVKKHSKLTVDGLLISYQEVAKEIADKAWEAAGEYEYRSNFGKVPTQVPGKEDFMKELFNT
jgi:hypothetical protein